MKEVSELVELAKKATPGRNYDRLDSCGGGIKYQCLGNDGSLVLQCDHKNNEYGFIGQKSLEDEAFFLACKPETILAIAEAFQALEQQLTNAQEALKSAGIEADTVQAGVMELVSRMNQVVAKGKELAEEAAYVYGKYNDEMAPDMVYDGQTIQEFFDVANSTKTTDACLNAVRAEGADKVAEYHFVRIDALKEVSRQGYLFHKAAYSDAVSVANLLRAGNAGKDGSNE